MEKYPYFLYPLVKEIEDCADPSEKERLQMKFAANVYAPESVEAPVGDLDFRGRVPAMKPEKSRQDETIDNFIEKFGRPADKTLDRPILPEQTAPADYFSSISEEGKEEEKKEETAVAEKKKAAPVKKIKKVEEKPKIGFELASEYLKNGKYDEAMQIIKEIYLNNPEKSIYFADQIRFIKKMMLNEKKK